MKPKILLHVCCGPCSIAIFKELLRSFDLVAYFYNPNIHPEKEYVKRKSEVVKLCRELKIRFVEEVYNPEAWFLRTEKYINEPEGGRRCLICFKIRLGRAANYAAKNDFDFFATSLTGGRNKDAAVINPIGIECGKIHGIEFFQEDWKKKGRQQHADRLVRERRVYRQNYCGCIYSKK